MNILFRRFKFLVSTILSTPSVAFVYSPLLVVQTAIGITIPFATGQFIDALVQGTDARMPFTLLAALSLASAVLTLGLQWFILNRARAVELKLQNRLLESAMRLSPGALAAFADGELVAKLTRDAYAVGGFVRGLYPRLLTAVATMLAAGFALHSRSALLAAAFVAFIPIAVFLFAPFARRFAANSRLVRRGSDRSYIVLFDYVRSLPFLRALDAAPRFADAPRDSLRALNDGNRAADALGTAFGGLLGATLVVGEIAVLGLAGMLAARGEIPVGDVVVYQMLFLTAMHSIQGIVSLLPEAAALRESVASLCEVLEHPAPARNGRMVKIRSIASVEFRNVSFSYPSARRPAIRNFSETFTPGQAVALLGANGAGKTTLLKLAAGALEPPTGEILVNGTPAHWIDMDSFRRRIGVVFQDNLLVSGTIIDNITLRDPALKKADVYAAAAASGLDEVVSHLPDGLDTRVGVGGQSLSGGECQRLAIARALVRKPDLLVLDEATNHLDAETRASFAKLLRQLVKDRIVLVVTHDSAIADLCDKKISCQIPEDPSYTIM